MVGGLLLKVERGTIVAMSTESLRTVRDRLSEFVDRAHRHHERVTITKNGRTAAVLMSADDLASLEETLELLSDPVAMAEIAEAKQSISDNDVVVGAEAVRSLLDRG